MAEIETEDRPAVPMADLIPGTRYDIEITDCCAECRLVGTFVEHIQFPATEGGGMCGARFDIGSIEPAWGQFTFREATS